MGVSGIGGSAPLGALGEMAVLALLKRGFGVRIGWEGLVVGVAAGVGLEAAGLRAAGGLPRRLGVGISGEVDLGGRERGLGGWVGRRLGGGSDIILMFRVFDSCVDLSICYDQV